MPKIFSVDAAIRENQPYVELRGRLYKLRDMTARERLERLIRFKEEEENRLERRSEELEGLDEEARREAEFAHTSDIIARAAQEALQDLPDEVAEGLTIMEWETLQTAVAEARKMVLPVEPETVPEDRVDKDDRGLKRAGRDVG